MNENTNNDKQDKKKEGSTLPTTTIDLDALDSTEALSEDKLIFYDECRRMVDNIRKKADGNIKEPTSRDSYDSNKEGEGSQSSPNCFFINGPRGSGKSTLLRAIRQYLISGTPTSGEETTVKLYPLADIDPTELGKGENFFIYLMGKIYALLDKRLKENNDDDLTTNLIKKALQGLRDMSSGLQILMDSEGILRNYETPEFFLENCLEKCADSSVMRKKLSSLIEILAKIVKTEVFLVTIDDADLNFRKCEDMLEYVRKYMQSPRLFFLFAGDMQLYSHIVRGMQLDNFHKKQLKYETSQASNRNDLLKSMGSQYLLKLFPVDNREFVSSLSEIVDIKRRIFIEYTSKNNKKEIIGIKEAIRKYLTIQTENIFVNTILQFPLRSILFLLRYLTNCPYPINSNEANQYAWKGIQAVSEQTLIDYIANYKEIIGTSNISLLQKTILEYKAQAGQWYGNLSMQPNDVDKQEKQVALYLGGAVSQGTMHLSAKIKYWCACFPLWQRMQEENLYSRRESDTYNLLQSCLHRHKERSSNSYADLACAAMAADIDERFLFSRGTICLLNEDCDQDIEKGQEARNGFKTLAKTFLKTNTSGNSNAKEDLTALNICLCRLDDSTSSYYYLSIYHLLMEIADWLDFGYEALMGEKQIAQTNATTYHAKAFKGKIRRKLSYLIVAPTVPRIRSLRSQGTAYPSRNLSSSINRRPTIERLAHITPYQADASTVEKMYKWLIKYVSTSYISTPEDYSNAWEYFKAECSEHAYNYSTEYQTVQECPKCAEILQGYMTAIENAMAFLPNVGENTLQGCIQEFPLWKALKDSLEDKSIFATKLNKTHIGYFINAKNRQTAHELKRAYEYHTSRVTEFEQALTTAASKNRAAQQQLLEAKNLKEEREIKYKRVQKYILDISEEQTKISTEYKSLFNLEQQLEHEIEGLRRKESEIVDSSSQVEKLLAQIERALKGECDNFPEYKFLIGDLQRHRRLKNQAKTEKTEQEHQKAIYTIQQEIKQRQTEEKNKFSKKDQRHALMEKTRLEEELANVRTIIWDKISQMKLTAKERQIKESDLTEVKKKLDDSMTREILAYVDQETARTNYSNVQKIANETQMVEDKARNDLNIEKKLCKEAEETYNKFKTYNPDV